MQGYLFERFLERLSKSKWRDNIVIKGSMLVSSLVGVASRTTMDLDMTITGLALTHESAEKTFREVAVVDTDDDQSFEFGRTEYIRETGSYPGICICLRAMYPSMAVPLKIAVMGDERTCQRPVIVRAVEPSDAMTADWAKLPYDVVGKISSRIVDEVDGVNRVVYDVTPKPPATIEWE